MITVIEGLREYANRTHDGDEWPTEIEAAINVIDQVTRERDETRALLADADERAHYAHGCGELAMKHRDLAERECAALKALLREVRQACVSRDNNYTAIPVAVLARLDAALEAQP